jgi:tetratricopeptide (TPR) repeat protein
VDVAKDEATGPHAVVELVAALPEIGDYDRAVNIAFHAIDVAQDQVAAAALLADVLSLIPTIHRDYLRLADREYRALTAIGRSSAALDRRRALLTVAEDRAIAEPDNPSRQRDLSISHNKLGELAAATGHSRLADHHYRIALAMRERLATADPDHPGHQRDLLISRNELGHLAAAEGNTRAADQHYRASLAIAERLAAADPDNADYQRNLSISHRASPCRRCPIIVRIGEHNWAAVPRVPVARSWRPVTSPPRRRACVTARPGDQPWAAMTPRSRYPSDLDIES